jgi:FKBP-type peptidyl-prolyl cis-trans isomerase FkpA
MKTILSLLVLISVVACGDYSDADKTYFDKEIKTYLEKNNLKLDKSTSGVYYKVLAKGTGKEILYSDNIRFIYKGTLLNGEIFDQQYSPVEIPLKNLIPAWREVIPGLAEGTSIMIVTPPHMGYGGQETGKIPPNSCLVFDLTILGRN